MPQMAWSGSIANTSVPPPARRRPRAEPSVLSLISVLACMYLVFYVSPRFCTYFACALLVFVPPSCMCHLRNNRLRCRGLRV